MIDYLLIIIVHFLYFKGPFFIPALLFIFLPNKIFDDPKSWGVICILCFVFTVSFSGSNIYNNDYVTILLVLALCVLPGAILKLLAIHFRKQGRAARLIPVAALLGPLFLLAFETQVMGFSSKDPPPPQICLETGLKPQIGPVGFNIQPAHTVIIGFLGSDWSDYQICKNTQNGEKVFGAHFIMLDGRHRDKKKLCAAPRAGWAQEFCGLDKDALKQLVIYKKNNAEIHNVPRDLIQLDDSAETQCVKNNCMFTIAANVAAIYTIHSSATGKQETIDKAVRDIVAEWQMPDNNNPEKSDSVP